MKNLLSGICVLSVFLLLTLACSNSGNSYSSKPLPKPGPSVLNNTVAPTASPSASPVVAKKKTPTPKPSPTDEEVLDVYDSTGKDEEKDDADRSSDTRRSYSTGSSSRSETLTESSRVYITGPRGGCYYWNRNGNKTYVDYSFCGRSSNDSSYSRSSSFSSSPQSSSGSYIRGPRGGCYTYSASGRKRYVDRSLCN
jgi:hypothetical protein